MAVLKLRKKPWDAPRGDSDDEDTIKLYVSDRPMKRNRHEKDEGMSLQESDATSNTKKRKVLPVREKDATYTPLLRKMRPVIEIPAWQVAGPEKHVRLSSNDKEGGFGKIVNVRDTSHPIKNSSGYEMKKNVEDESEDELQGELEGEMEDELEDEPEYESEYESGDICEYEVDDKEPVDEDLYPSIERDEKPVKATHHRFESEEAKDELSSTTREQMPVQEDAYEIEDSEDDAPEVVKSQEAKRIFKDHFQVKLKDGTKGHARPRSLRSAVDINNLPDLLPPEYLEEDDEPEIAPTLPNKGLNNSKRIKFNELKEKHPKDVRIGNTTYRVNKSSNAGLAPKPSFHAHSTKETLLRGRASNGKSMDRKPFSMRFSSKK